MHDLFLLDPVLHKSLESKSMFFKRLIFGFSVCCYKMDVP